MKTFISNILSRPIFQRPFEALLNFSLKVSNIGEGQTVETSGEKIVFQILDNITKDKNAIVFDVGAHIGEWFNLFKKSYKKASTVYSFEPSKKSYTELSKIKSEGFYPENLALGNALGKKYLLSNETKDSMACICDDKGTSKFSEEINIISLDLYCEKHSIKTIDLLKLDVEGFELQVLNGSKNLLKNGNINLIQFEFGAQTTENYSLKDFFQLLNEQYQICRILKHGYYPLKEYKHFYEIMTITNFIAIKRDLLNN